MLGLNKPSIADTASIPLLLITLLFRLNTTSDEHHNIGLVRPMRSFSLFLAHMARIPAFGMFTPLIVFLSSLLERSFC